MESPFLFQLITLSTRSAVTSILQAIYLCLDRIVALHAIHNYARPLV